MNWVTEQECLSFLKFLEISPMLNNHGNLKIHFFCFYISELKNLKQTLSLLLEAQEPEWDKNTANNEMTRDRYKRYKKYLKTYKNSNYYNNAKYEELKHSVNLKSKMLISATIEITQKKIKNYFDL